MISCLYHTEFKLLKHTSTTDTLMYRNVNVNNTKFFIYRVSIYISMYNTYTWCICLACKYRMFAWHIYIYSMYVWCVFTTRMTCMHICAVLDIYSVQDIYDKCDWHLWQAWLTSMTFMIHIAWLASRNSWHLYCACHHWHSWHFWYMYQLQDTRKWHLWVTWHFLYTHDLWNVCQL
jgi:hypothetical protein